MSIGIIVNSACVLIGGLLGSFLGRLLPTQMRESLYGLFGYCSIIIGIILLQNIKSMPAVTLALIVGTIIGEALRIEDQIKFVSLKLKIYIERLINTATADNDTYIRRFVGLLMLFCTGSTGILGAIGEGVNGDSTVLLTKSVMDIFAAFAFAAHMGPMIACIAIPQFLFFSLLFWSASFIMPLTDPLMIGDFMACGGILAIITGFRICELKDFRIANTLPALFIVMPLSYLWRTYF
ncbi:DUF554 domain-containing protein [uncultured Phascolarctobacterium sp.]|uniref:DUF554 domain-containing protein n=1 Tax=uncultured Phascolarctobacterium sp. TaxID=512296 RepID=UPI0025D58DE4|nr:DUF554 domain-containing protein [uncultured Phascolarctobacterium sp.]